MNELVNNCIEMSNKAYNRLSRLRDPVRWSLCPNTLVLKTDGEVRVSSEFGRRIEV